MNFTLKKTKNKELA